MTVHIDWDEFHRRVKKELVLVTFKKVSTGEIREMQATLAEYLLPETSGAGWGSKDPDLVTVFDLEKEGWRAFRKSTVIGVEYLCPEENA